MAKLAETQKFSFTRDPADWTISRLVTESNLGESLGNLRGFKQALRYCRECSKDGRDWVGFIQEVEDGLEAQGSSYQGDFSEAIYQRMQEPEPPNLQELVSEYIRNEFVGLIEFDTKSESIQLTSKGLRTPGIFQKTLADSVWAMVLKDVPGATNRSLPLGDLKSLLRSTCAKYLRAKGPQDELRDTFRVHGNSFPSPEALRDSKMPSRISKATGGPWGEIKTLMEPLWGAYGIRGFRSKEGFFRFIVGIATLTMEPGRSCQWALFLSGPGGCGKTSFGQTLALTTAPSATLTKDSLEYKKIIEIFERASVGIVDEIDTWNRKSEILKSILSANEFSARMAYAEQTRILPRSWMWLATSNQSTMQDDGAGLRRYFPVKLKGGVAEGQKRLEFLKGYRETLHALGYLMYQVGYPMELDPELVQLNSETGLKEESEIKDLVRQFGPKLGECICKDQSRIDKLSITNMIEALGQPYTSRHYSDVRDTLTELGWQYKTVRDAEGTPHPRTWFPPGFSQNFEIVRIPHSDSVHHVRKILATST